MTDKEPAAPLLIDANARANLVDLRERAALRPIAIDKLGDALATPQGKAAHRAQMHAQTVVIDGPWPFFVTLSVETGHPVGVCRHMSMSVMRKGRVPHPAAVWMVAEELGFIGGLSACKVWPEDLSDGGAAINIVQPVSVVGPAGQPGDTARD